MKEMLDLIGAYIFVYVIHVYYAYVGCAWKKNKRRKKKKSFFPPFFVGHMYYVCTGIQKWR
jgi:hypothetical protein